MAVLSDSSLEKNPDQDRTGEPSLGNVAEPGSVPEAPEGGNKAWLSLLGASTAMFVSFGWVNCIALFQAEYETNQLKKYSPSTVSWITSMECKYELPEVCKSRFHINQYIVFFILFMSPLAGRMFDNYGPRLPVAIGTFMHVFGLMMTSLSKEYYQFALSQSVCSGIGASLIFTPCMTAVSTIKPPIVKYMPANCNPSSP